MNCPKCCVPVTKYEAVWECNKCGCRWYILMTSQSDERIDKTSRLILPGDLYRENQFDDNMSWSNYAVYWEFDHIRPVSSFDLSDLKQQEVCFHYTNIRPLEKYANRSKGAKYNA